MKGKSSNYAEVSILLLTYDDNCSCRDVECWDIYKITDGTINEKKDIKAVSGKIMDFVRRKSTKVFKKPVFGP